MGSNEITPLFKLFAAVALAASTATAQALSASVAVVSALHSSGYDCATGPWNQTIPVGPLAAGVTSVPDVTWNLGASSLSVAASGSAIACVPCWPCPGHSSIYSTGTIDVTLSSPYDTDVLIAINGSVSATSNGTARWRVAVDGVDVADLDANYGLSATNQSMVVTVGPAGVDLRFWILNIVGLGAFQGPGSTSVNGNLSWSQLDAASVTSVPGGCAPPTSTPTFAAAGLPILGSSIEADILQAQGPAPLGLVMFGLEQAMIPLDSYGMPGCNAMQSLYLTYFAQPTGPSELHLSVPLPNDPGLAGVRLYSQAFTQALGANALGLVAGNALHWHLGS